MILLYFSVYLLAAVALRVLFRLYENEERRDTWQQVEARIHSVCTHIFGNFTAETKDVWSPLLILILREILHLGDARVRFNVILNLLFSRPTVIPPDLFFLGICSLSSMLPFTTSL